VVAALAFYPSALYLSFVNPSTSPQIIKRVLLVAYYFPPLGMSGTQRVAKWGKYFLRLGWEVTIITVKPIAYYAFHVIKLAIGICGALSRRDKMKIAQRFYLWEIWHGNVSQSRTAWRAVCDKGRLKITA